MRLQKNTVCSPSCFAYHVFYICGPLVVLTLVLFVAAIVLPFQKRIQIRFELLFVLCTIGPRTSVRHQSLCIRNSFERNSRPFAPESLTSSGVAGSDSQRLSLMWGLSLVEQKSGTHLYAQLVLILSSRGDMFHFEGSLLNVGLRIAADYGLKADYGLHADYGTRALRIQIWLVGICKNPDKVLAVFGV